MFVTLRKMNKVAKIDKEKFAAIARSRRRVRVREKENEKKNALSFVQNSCI